MIKAHPIKGVGIGNFGKFYSIYIMPGANQTNFSHNSYLQLWAETGILGLGAFLWIVFTFFRIGFRGLENSGVKGIQIGSISAGIAFLTHNIIDYDFFVPEVAFHWWIILGLLETSLYRK